MEEVDEETKKCENCKREIPAVNFTIHSVHCARNLRLCPVCKEPVQANLLTEHHDALHKPLPCKQCGESVCGTDLEDHIRDSCGHTVKSCRFCELELPRRDLPTHENYCGTRTEQCSDCKEWVMLKYRQLHVQSNHGFIRLDDDPIPPQARAETSRPANMPKPPIKPTNIPSLPTNDRPANREGPRTIIRHLDHITPNVMQTASSSSPFNNGFLIPSTSKVANKNGEPKNSNIPSSTNSHINFSNVKNSATNMPKTSTSVHNSATNVPNNSTNVRNSATNVSNVNKNLNNPVSGSSKPDVKPLLPKNLQNRPSSSKMSDSSEFNAVNGVNIPKRENDQPQPNVNVANGSKLSKQSPSRGAVKKRQAPMPPREPTQRDPIREAALTSALHRFYDEQQQRDQQNAYNARHGLPPVLSPLEKLEKLRKMDALHNREVDDDSWKDRLRRPVFEEPKPSGNILGSEPSQRPQLHAERRKDQRQPPRNQTQNGGGDARRNDLRNLKPMSGEEFAARFQRMQLAGGDAEPPQRNDRFSEIKSSLHALRRGLNEVTAPYINPSPISPVSNLNYQLQFTNENRERRSPSPEDDHDDEEVRLPCEFCGIPVPAMGLVQHQTGCRPDLAQLPRRVAAASPPRPAAPYMDLYEDPVIPCEFCVESLPLHLIGEHQERCRLQNNDDYSD